MSTGRELLDPSLSLHLTKINIPISFIFFPYGRLSSTLINLIIFLCVCCTSSGISEPQYFREVTDSVSDLENETISALHLATMSHMVIHSGHEERAF